MLYFRITSVFAGLRLFFLTFEISFLLCRISVSNKFRFCLTLLSFSLVFAFFT